MKKKQNQPSKQDCSGLALQHNLRAVKLNQKISILLSHISLDNFEWTT